MKATPPGAFLAVCTAFLALLFLVQGTSAAPGNAAPASAQRNDWYRHSVVNIHFDNHSTPVGQDLSVDELTKLIGRIPCSMVQVSAQSMNYATYPTKVGVNNPNLRGYDTLATFKEVARRLNIKLCIYIATDWRWIETKEHPEWAATDADGKPGTRMCLRPNKEKKGYLYERYLPQILEIISKYDPDGFWFDGDTQAGPCWCSRCLKAWQDDTGLEPPRDEGSPNWQRWIEWHYARHDEFRRIVAETIHKASPKALFTGNWSYAWTPQPVPGFIDTLSGDASQLRQVQCTVMRWGAQQKAPWDIMTFAMPSLRLPANSAYPHSLQRTLQEGALVMASGGVWFVWTFGITVSPHEVDMTRYLAAFARDRESALGPSTSLSQVAVLDSETSWRPGGRATFEGQVSSVARSLQESHYLTDIVNEETLRARLTPYQVVVVPGHARVASETLSHLRAFVERGGLVLLTGAALEGQGEDELEDVVKLLGVKRRPPEEGRLDAPALGNAKRFYPGLWQVDLGSAEVLASFSDGRPALTRNQVGKGTVGYLAVSDLQYPDDGLMADALHRLGKGSSYAVGGGGAGAPIVCSLRRKPGEVVLHVTNLTTVVNGERRDIETPAYTDWNPELERVSITLPFPEKPARVSGVPAGTLVDAAYADGALTLTLSQLHTHAAVVMSTKAEPPFGMLPAGTPLAAASFHPEDEATGRAMADDFEAARVGSVPSRPWVAEVKEPTAITATDETASQGTRSLKLVDSTESSFYPFLHWSLSPFNRGAARMSCSLRVDRGAKCTVELRNEGWGAGPAVVCDGDGKIIAAGKTVAQVQPGTWFRMAVAFGLGTQKPDYEVTVEAPGQEPRTVAALPYASPWFSRCDSLYFIGAGESAASFYLDDVALERLPAP